MKQKFKHILAIHGAPRSGTTWLGQIIDSNPNIRYKYQPLFSDSFKDRINVRSTKEDILKFYNDIYDYVDDFLDRTKEKNKGIHQIFKYKEKTPVFLMTKMVRYHYLLPHLLSLLDEIKVIGVVRNPCGAIASWLNNPKEFFNDMVIEDEWRFAPNRNNFRPEEYFGYYKWKEVSKLFLQMKNRYPDKFVLIRYEELYHDTDNHIRELFDFIGLELIQQTLDFINKSKSEYKEDAYSVFKANKDINDWKNLLDAKIIQEIYTDLMGTEFEQFLQ